MEKFHEKLKMLRKKEGLTQQEVADKIGINRPSYSNWEKGRREPSFENLSMLACIFDVSIDFLLSENLEISKERCLKFMKMRKQKMKSKEVEIPQIPQFIADWVDKLKSGLFGLNYDSVSSEIYDWVYAEEENIKKLHLAVVVGYKIKEV
ncbi:helix-turn-helix domain-containing protein [Streptococcus mitis]|uniref:helix-turn-helix domain-containing protein n=1 Tax=Streptococcus mitis TaxID=28037 RepID=UPI00200128D8|nr:helix-turn-helix domain-containing protein [Streptococcus mitis]